MWYSQLHKINKVIIYIFDLLFCYSECLASARMKEITAVPDTFQLGEHAIELYLPQNSVIMIGKNPNRNGQRCGAIFLDSLNMTNPIYINDVTYASTSSIDVTEPDLIETAQLPNVFTIRLFKCTPGYVIRAFSENRKLSFYWVAPTEKIAKTIIPIFMSVRILPLIDYDNTKSARKKKWAKVR